MLPECKPPTKLNSGLCSHCGYEYVCGWENEDCKDIEDIEIYNVFNEYEI